VNPGFCEKIEVSRLPPGRPSRTTSGTRTTDWEPLLHGFDNPSSSDLKFFWGFWILGSLLVTLHVGVFSRYLTEFTWPWAPAQWAIILAQIFWKLDKTPRFWSL